MSLLGVMGGLDLKKSLLKVLLDMDFRIRLWLGIGAQTAIGAMCSSVAHVGRSQGASG